MKRLLFIMILLSFSCQTTPNKLELAKEKILTKIKESANDWNSYESVKWGTLDSSFNSVFDDSLFIATSLKIDKAKFNFSDNLTWYLASENIDNKIKNHEDSISKAQNVLDSLKENFKPEFNGYTLTHSYRLSNQNGIKTIHHDLYFLDKNFEIFKVLDISANYYDNDNDKQFD